jgi:uncharacterized OsmC-like protein
LTTESAEVEPKTQRREENTTVLTAIELVYHIRGDVLAPETVEHAIQKAEEKLCPVLAMLRPGTEITSSRQID